MGTLEKGTRQGHTGAYQRKENVSDCEVDNKCWLYHYS